MLPWMQRKRMRWFFVHGWALVLFSTLACTGIAKPLDDAQRAISLIDYIARDYQNAVAKHGQTIISQAEYREMVDFVSLVQGYTKVAGALDHGHVVFELDKLKNLVDQRAPVSQVEEVALSIRRNLISLFDIATSPKYFPDLSRGKDLYEKSCGLCHGMDGRAQTRTAQQLIPLPTAFADVELLNVLSPFQAYNTITYGIRDTSMASFSWFSDEDRWALANYIFTFRPDLPPPKPDLAPDFPWKEAMIKTDIRFRRMLNATSSTCETGAL